MEKFMYEVRPYLFFVIGVLSITLSHGSGVRQACGAMLLLAAGFVIRQRYLNRAQIRYF